MSKFEKVLGESVGDLSFKIKSLKDCLNYLDSRHKGVRDKLSQFSKEKGREGDVQDLKKILHLIEDSISALQNTINNLQDIESMIIPNWKIF